MEIKQIKELKKGEFFRLYRKGWGYSLSVYVRGEYDRSEKKYLATKYFDVNDWRYFKPTQKVAVGFEF